jgi:pyridoxal phosphate enzyme (YggS family)
MDKRIENIVENVGTLRKQIPDHVQMIAVSKFKSVNEILAAYQAGQRLFGENKAQEMAAKYQNLPKDIQWHFIGHLQTNKVKYIVPFVHMIHSIDSQHLLEYVNRIACNNNRIVDVLLQFYIANENTKFGFLMDEAIEMLQSSEFQTYQNIRVKGVMGIATFTDNPKQIRDEFRTLKQHFHQLKSAYFANNPHFNALSMGMSDDFPIAVEEGATYIRVGSAIFGARNY